MLGNLRIASRLSLLIGVQIVILLIIGLFALNGLRSGSDSTEVVFNKGQDLVDLNNMAINIANLQQIANRVNTGAMTWADGRNNLKQVKSDIDKNWATLNKLTKIDQGELESSYAGVNDAHNELNKLFTSENTSYLSLFILNDIADLIDPFKQSLQDATRQSQKQSSETHEQALKTVDNYFLLTSILIIGGLILMGIIGYFIYRSIVNPMNQISETVHKVAEGDFDIRSHLKGSDEITELGNALDNMLDDKVQSLVNTEKSNESLNESVFTLLESVALLSERDLTVNVPVAQDITGTVADAINMMVDEIVDVLSSVNDIAVKVDSSSTQVNSQAKNVNESAEIQKNLSKETSLNLSNASKQLHTIAKIAVKCDSIAKNTSTATQKAEETVNETLASMEAIRDSIQETGKRIKGLGERSQEISSIVDIINTLSERTHVLALNASMQAAAAGEAGRGFAVVADEVQRLAQSSRDATAQISTLVKNIQLDTNDTIANMDKTISTVIVGENMATSAGEQMVINRTNTQQLVKAVNIIAQQSKKQALESQNLLTKSEEMIVSSNQTTLGMSKQIKQTEGLVKYSKNLLETVKVFKLPEATADK